MTETATNALNPYVKNSCQKQPQIGGSYEKYIAELEGWRAGQWQGL